MHVPDGFLSAGVSVATGVASAGGIGYSLMRAKESLSDRLAPMAGLVAAFVFAVQMLNFPVAAGTSGHLLGGALACIMVGPWAGTIAVAIVLVVQALLFADGGLTALGTNILLISIIPAMERPRDLLRHQEVPAGQSSDRSSRPRSSPPSSPS